MNCPLKEIFLQNLLSFGPDGMRLELGPLNVLIGPNGSGKSNLINAVSLLAAAPKDLSAPVKETGGIRDWIWQGNPSETATIEVTVTLPPDSGGSIQHLLRFEEERLLLQVSHEIVKTTKLDYNNYTFTNKKAGITRMTADGVLETEEDEVNLKLKDIRFNESILSQVKDAERYPTFDFLSNLYSSIRLYREWSFGHHAASRQPQRADLPSEFLMENGENLAHVLNAMKPKAKVALLENLSYLYPGIKDFNVQFPAGWVQLFLEENNFHMPANRLSDGTLRYLCLLAVLCHPTPPPVVCIEEPELGLHPDVIHKIADLLKEASKRCQLIVTTHSTLLIDALTDTPEAVIVCDKQHGATTMNRLDSKALAKWLRKYTLGELWTKGEIGGNRW